ARQGLPPGEVTLADLLRARGYRTAAYGKWHLGFEEAYGPLERGFDEHYGFYEAFSLYSPVDDARIVNTPIDDFSDRHMWSTGRNGRAAIVHNDEVVEEDEYLTFRFAELAADYVEANAEDPFFLYLPFSAPHTPLQAPQAYYDRFDAIDDPVRRTYAAMIAAFDDAVATVLDAIDDAGIADDTMVIFTSDNGGASYLGVTDNEPFAGGKFTIFQGGMAVPLMIRYPGVVEPGTVYAEPVSLLDVFATVDAATGPGPGSAPRPDQLALDGVDLLPFLAGEADGRPADALYWRSEYNKAVRRGDWKLIVTTDRSPAVAEDAARYELYNLRRDPAERINVAATNPRVVADLLCRLNGWEGTLAEPLWPPVMHFRHDIWGRRLWFAI
ncbi:MAG: sulfatase-like hydrolase/transferase, partial [Spirochaetota bacterium]